MKYCDVGHIHITSVDCILNHKNAEFKNLFDLQFSCLKYIILLYFLMIKIRLTRPFGHPLLSKERAVEKQNG